MLFRELELGILEIIFEKELDNVSTEVRKKYPETAKHEKAFNEIVKAEKQALHKTFKGYGPSILMTKYLEQVPKDTYPMYYSGIHLGALVDNSEKEERLLEVLENNL